MEFLAPVFLLALNALLTPADAATTQAKAINTALGSGSTSTVYYNSGTPMSARKLYKAIDLFCDGIIGQKFEPKQSRLKTYRSGTAKVVIEVIAGKDCSFVVDSRCKWLLRVPVDGCNPGSEEKQGGHIYEAPCGAWRIDPA